MQDFQEGLVDVWLALEAVLDLVDIVYGVVELHGLVVLERWPAGGRAAHGSVGLNGGRARRGVGWDGRVGLAGGCVGWRLNGLQEGRQTRQKVNLPTDHRLANNHSSGDAFCTHGTQHFVSFINHSFKQ